MRTRLAIICIPANAVLAIHGVTEGSFVITSIAITGLLGALIALATSRRSCR